MNGFIRMGDGFLRHARGAPVVIVFVTVAILAVFIVPLIEGQETATDFLTQTLATLVGVMVAFAATIRANDATTREDERHTLRVIGNELENAQEGLQRRFGANYLGAFRRAQREPLKDGLWTALVQGGTVSRIREPDLLSVIAGAYQEIQHVKVLESQWVDMPNRSSNPDDDSKEYNSEFADHVHRAVERARDATNDALKEIKSKVSEIEGAPSTEKGSRSQTRE